MTAATAVGHRERPFVDIDIAPFWDGVQRWVLLVQECGGCGHLRFPFVPACGRCGADAWTAREVSGGGTIHSFVTVHLPAPPGLPSPYTTGLIDLDEGPRMVGLLRADADADDEPFAIGQRVVVDFVEDGGFVFPDFFRPSSRP